MQRRILIRIIALICVFVPAVRTVNAAGLILNSTELALFESCGLKGVLDQQVFAEAYRGLVKYHPARSVLAIADFTQPSNKQRLFIIDLASHKLLLQTYVAHGKNSGDLMANSFSNENASHKSSPGFYLVGEKIKSPKHGDALLLNGLQQGINDQARKREIIIHSADYVSDAFIRSHGRLGRSYGCPAVSKEVLPYVISYLEGGSLLYIHSGGN